MHTLVRPDHHCGPQFHTPHTDFHLVSYHKTALRQVHRLHISVDPGLPASICLVRKSACSSSAAGGSSHAGCSQPGLCQRRDCPLPGTHTLRTHGCKAVLEAPPSTPAMIKAALVICRFVRALPLLATNYLAPQFICYHKSGVEVVHGLCSAAA